MKQRILVPFIMLLGLALNCSDKDNFRNICAKVACQAGEICKDGKCYVHCQTDDECEQDYICKNEICVPTVCGDGLIEGQEECDNGDDNADDRICTAACMQAFCGDSLLLRYSKGKEECDDGNTDDLDECTNDCTLPACGDGRMQTGETCMDGFSCTLDKCFNDECISTKRDCSGIIIFSECQTAICDEKLGCITKAINIGGFCDDGMACTENDVCQSNGMCAGSIRDCSQIITDQKCQNARCEEPVGCVIDAINIGESCDDGQLCSSNDTCRSDGSCIGESAVDCSHLVTDLSCQSARCDDTLGCIQVPINIGHNCEDSLFCTEQDHCDTTGTCIGEQRDCSDAISVPECQISKCDEAQDLCYAAADHVGESCSDELDCTENDICAPDGTCGGDLIDCDHLLVEPQCQAALCEEQNGCYTGPANIGDPCDDGIGNTYATVCLEDESCGGGSIRTEAFVQVAAGYKHTCGITAKHDVYCWGDNSYGALGNNTLTGISNVPEKIDVSSIIESKQFVHVEAGNQHSCGLNTNGDIYCWGNNGSGQLGLGSTTNQTLPVMVDMSSISIGSKKFLQVTTGLSNLTFDGHTCGIVADGKVYCFGANTSGKLGNSAGLDDQTLPVAINTVGIKKTFLRIAAGFDHTCGINSSGVAYCWGQNSNGQLGIGSHVTSSESPKPVNMNTVLGVQTFAKIATGLEHTCALTAHGKAYCWGKSTHGCLGSLTGNDIEYVPIPVDTSNLEEHAQSFIQITAGRLHTCAISQNRKIYCWGKDDFGQVGDSGEDKTAFAPVQVDSTHMFGAPYFSYLDAGNNHTCGITVEGDMYCWGSNQTGELGIGTQGGYMPYPESVDIRNVDSPHLFVQMNGGKKHTCGLTSRGQPFCFGRHKYVISQIPEKEIDEIIDSIPVSIDTKTIVDQRSFLGISAGGKHSCGINALGDVYCWGVNKDGQLGIGETTVVYEFPMLVDSSVIGSQISFVDIGTGLLHSCGLTAKGKIYCWGSDSCGQLGNDIEQLDSLVPVQVATSTIIEGDDKEFIELSVGPEHNCAITSQGKAYCWGSNTFGECGNDAWCECEFVPVEVHTRDPQTATDYMNGDNTFRQIAAGNDHTCGIATDGKLYCFGDYRNGQLGIDGLDTKQIHPVQVDRANNSTESIYRQITAGDTSSCGVDSEFITFCFGEMEDDSGVNTITITSSTSPAKIPSSKAFVQLDGGQDQMCGVTDQGGAFCWGADDAQQLGWGEEENSTDTPQKVDISNL